MPETIPQTSQDTIKEVTERFNLDPFNQQANINAIAYLYEENRKKDEKLKRLEKYISIISEVIKQQALQEAIESPFRD